MLKKLFSHTAIYGLAPQVPKIASVLTLPVITRYLTEIDFGVYGVIVAVAGSISVLGTLGLNIILSNTFFKSPGHYKWAWRQIYGFLILWNLPFAFLLGLILYFFIPQEAAQNNWYIILLNVIPVICFGPVSNLGSLYYQLNQKPYPIAIRAIIIGLLTVILNVYFIAYLKLGYMGWFISNCIASLLSNASYWIPLNLKLGMKPIFNFKLRFIKNSLSVSLPIVPHYYSNFILDSSDRLIMKMVNISTPNIGLYNAAYTVANLVKEAGTAAGNAISPMLNSAYKKDKDKEARSLIFVTQIAFLAMTFLLSIWLKEVFILLIKNKTLQTVYPIGIIIIMAYNYRPMYYGSCGKLFYEEKTKLLLRVTFIAAISNLILNFIFIPLYGYQVAAYTTFAALMYMGYSGYFFKVFKQINKANYYPLHWLTATIILTAVAYFVVDENIIIKIVSTIATLIIGLYLIKKINKF